MNIEEFRSELTCKISELLNERARVEVCDVSKNNGVILRGILIHKKGVNITPTIYVEEYFREYEEGTSIDDIAKDIIIVNEQSKFKGEIDGDFYKDYESVKNKMHVKLINTEQNRELLSQVPHREFLDLSLVTYCDISEICHMGASILVRNEHVKMWGINPEEMIDKAYENTKRAGCKIRDMAYFLEGTLENEIEKSAVRELSGKMFVMANNSDLFGAVCMTYDDKLDEFLEPFGGGVYIIPSSIHEVILIPDNGRECPEDLNNMIETVNRESLEKEDVLASHAYYYNPREGYITV